MKKMMKIMSCLLALLLVLTGCSGQGGNEPAPAEKSATYALAGNWNTLQPGHYSEAGYYGPLVWQHIYDALVIPTDTDYKPRGAKSWQLDDSGKVITFQLDETAKFTDGQPVTAADWVFSAKLIADIDFGSPDYTKLTTLFAGTEDNG